MVNATRPEQPDQTMNVHFSLKIAGDVQSSLEEKVARGEVVPADEIAKLYTASSLDRDGLVEWLNDNGYQNVRASRDGVYAQAKASVLC